MFKNISTLILLAGFGLLATGCSEPEAAAESVTPTVAATATATPTTAVTTITPKPSGTPTPAQKATSVPAPKSTPTSKPATTPKPATPAPTTATSTIDSIDYDCADFSTHAEAQAYFISQGGSATNNVDRLDADHDGSACDSLK